MITMDLMKRQALPPRSNVKGAAITGVAFSIPAVLMLLILSGYLHDRIFIQTQTRVLEEYESRFDNLKASLDKEKLLQEKLRTLNMSLIEVSGALDDQAQWSQILMALGEHLPHPLVVDRLEVKVRQISETVPSRDDPTRKINVPRPVRTLSIGLYSVAGSDGDPAVKDFQHKLMESKSFTAVVKDVVIASRTPGKDHEKDIIRYELNCALKANESWGHNGPE